MNIEVRLRKGKFGNANVKAYGSIVIDEAFIVHGIRVLESKNGKVFVDFPSRLRSDGNYETIAYPWSKEAYSNIILQNTKSSFQRILKRQKAREKNDKRRGNNGIEEV